MPHDWLVMSVAWGAKGQLVHDNNLAENMVNLWLQPFGAHSLKPCQFSLPALQIRLWIYKPFYTTHRKKYPVLCAGARSLIQKYCRVFIHFVFIVWTSFNERVPNMARSHARNVAESFKFLEVDILKTCRPTFEWTVCWMSWLFKNATSMEWSVETAKKQALKVSIALNVVPSGATIALQLITLSEPIKTIVCWRLRIFNIKILKTCWSGQHFVRRSTTKTKSWSFIARTVNSPSVALVL